jgi:hypothetical protein
MHESVREARGIMPDVAGLATPIEFGHFVQFYETERFLVDSVANFFQKGFAGEEIALGIGTSAHGTAIAEELQSRGIDLRIAEERKQYIWLLSLPYSRRTRAGCPCHSPVRYGTGHSGRDGRATSAMGAGARRIARPDRGLGPRVVPDTPRTSPAFS